MFDGRRFGFEKLQAEARANVETGARIHLRRVLASDGLAVIEAAMENFREHPGCCSAGTPIVLEGAEAPLSRVCIYNAPGPPR